MNNDIQYLEEQENLLAETSQKSKNSVFYNRKFRFLGFLIFVIIGIASIIWLLRGNFYQVKSTSKTQNKIVDSSISVSPTDNLGDESVISNHQEGQIDLTGQSENIPNNNQANNSKETIQKISQKRQESKSSVYKLTGTFIPLQPSGNQSNSVSGDFGRNTGQNKGNNTQSSKNLTDEWNEISDTNYGYILLYPTYWVPDKTVTTDRTQSIQFRLNSNNQSVIAIFYITALVRNQIFLPNELSTLQNQYQTKIYISKKGNAYSYQCIPVLDNEIVSTCSIIENTITFTD